jgi:hypothetical protein
MNFDFPKNQEGKEQKPEKWITKPAVLFRDTVYTSDTIHAEAYAKIQEQYPEETIESLYDKAVDGFVTRAGEFLTREQAWRVAKENGQLSHLEEGWEANRDPDFLDGDPDDSKGFDSTDLHFADLLPERKQPGWDTLFAEWEQLEKESGEYTALWQERGFASWREWREAYIKPLGVGGEIWNIGVLPNPTKAILDFYGAPTYTWQQKVYGGAQILPFSDIIQTSFVQSREKIKQIQENFPAETLLIAIEYEDKKILIEGMHRACALASWPDNVPFTGTVRLAIANLSGRNRYPDGLPNIGNNYADRNH